VLDSRHGSAEPIVPDADLGSCEDPTLRIVAATSQAGPAAFVQTYEGWSIRDDVIAPEVCETSGVKKFRAVAVTAAVLALGLTGCTAAEVAASSPTTSRSAEAPVAAPTPTPTTELC
jgi:hypothetical protein